ncbi:MAG: FAD-dependent oxidoreductase [Actinomycetaceae bacterium]|nr:FAD-dependent oxidoreductase [Actinomycetaceae bacterium]
MKADIVIIGGGLAGMSAAYEAVAQGLKPIVVETRGRPGGLIASAKLAGVPFDIGAESWATRSPVVGDLVDELDLERTDPTGRSWVWNQQLQRAYPIPEGTLGLPADIDAPEVLTAIGADGVARAKQDLTMGPDVAADAEDLASLISRRVGDAVLNHLVRPVAGGIHTADPSKLAADAVTPGLRAGMRRTGSLLLAAKELAERNPGPKVAQTRGGMFRLIEALEREVVTADGTMLLRHAATQLARDGDAWRVTVQATQRGADPAAEPVPTGPQISLETERVIVALPGPLAMKLLAGVVTAPLWELPLGAPIAHQVLMIDHHGLDDGPRGSGLLITEPGNVDQPIRAKALSHLSYKWGWMSEVLAPGRHILRMSYGRLGEEYPNPTVDSALAEANRLLDLDMTAEDVVASMLIRWDGQLAPQTPEHREKVTQFHEAIKHYPGLEVTGAWVAGSGFAAVVPHGRTATKALVS